jgi:hypothetical protein
MFSATSTAFGELEYAVNAHEKQQERRPGCPSKELAGMPGYASAKVTRYGKFSSMRITDLAVHLHNRAVMAASRLLKLFLIPAALATASDGCSYL